MPRNRRAARRRRFRRPDRARPTGDGLDDCGLVDGRRRLGLGRGLRRLPRASGAGCAGLSGAAASRRGVRSVVISSIFEAAAGAPADDGRLARSCGDRLVGGTLRGSLCGGRLGRERRGGALLHLRAVPMRPSSPGCALPACSPCSSSSRCAWCERPSPPHRGSQRHLPMPNGRRECASKRAWARRQRASQTPRRPCAQPSRSSLRRPSPPPSWRPRPTWPRSCGPSSSAPNSRASTSSASRRRSIARWTSVGCRAWTHRSACCSRPPSWCAASPCVVFAALDFAARRLRAAVGFAALDFAAAVRGLDGRPPACPDRDTRWSDTPVPVPSAASSS